MSKGTGKGGCYAFFATVRPREGLTDECVGLCLDFANKFCQYSLFVIEKEGTERHGHWFLFPHIAQQRSNVISLIIKHCLKPCGWDDAELHNFRKWDKASGNGCVKTCTSLDFVKYVDGTYAKKTEDFFEVAYELLPDDLNELEKWIPEVGALERRKNIKFHTLEKQLKEKFNLPPRSEGMKLSLALLQRMFYALENHDVRECICDNRVARQFVERFHRWYNMYDHDDSYAPACRGEITSIEDALAHEVAGEFY